MKKWIVYVLYGLLLAAAVGLLVWEVVIRRNNDPDTYMKAGLIIISLVAGMTRLSSGSRRKVSNKKAAYGKAYGEFIGNAFDQEPKLEKLLYSAIDDYNQNKPARAISKLEKLRGQCTRTVDRYAVVVFMGLCYDEMRLFDKAITEYTASLQIRENSTLASNLGLCRERKGDLEGALGAYDRAVRIDPRNHFAYNNLAQLHIRIGEYGKAKEYAQKAVDINQKMPQALNAMAICSYMLGDQASYERWYRQAVSCGSDGSKLKAYIQSLDASL